MHRPRLQSGDWLEFRRLCETSCLYPVCRFTDRTAWFAVRDHSEMAPAFHRIAEDLSHGHLLAFRPAEDPADGWHSTHVSVRGRSRSVRAREGYSPD